MKTKNPVIFRYDPKNDEVIAFFPKAYNQLYFPGRLMTYAHIGQHGDADINFYRSLRPATFDQYFPLLMELQFIGYWNLDIKQRITR